jgi:hypothetical protein
MEISKTKLFVHKPPHTGELVFSRDLDAMRETVKDYKIALFGIQETEEGDILFRVSFKYDGEPYLEWHKFMHIKSFLDFHPYFDKIYLDKFSEHYINTILELKK